MQGLYFMWLLLAASPLLLRASDIHGGTMLAMKGADCVVLAADSRFASYRTGSFLLGSYPRMLFRVGRRCLVGCIGLDSDARQLLQDVKDKVEEHSELEPASVARVVSNALYRRRMAVSPIVCGIATAGRGSAPEGSPALDQPMAVSPIMYGIATAERGSAPEVSPALDPSSRPPTAKATRGQPYICAMDSLGAQTTSSFAVCGTADAGLYAICENLYQEGLGADELGALVERVISLALQRDVLSGGEVDIYTLHADGRLERRKVDTFDV